VHLLDGPEAGLLIEAVQVWAKSHPLYDQPLLDIGEDPTLALTPEDIARALRDPHDQAHGIVVDLLESGLSGYRGSRQELIAQLVETFLGKADRQGRS
jgi:hypothetical protein